MLGDCCEDHHAAVVATEVAKGLAANTLSPFIGLRVKPLNEEMRVRSVKTLDLVLTKLVESGGIPDRWIVTIPKVTIIEQVEYAVAVLRELEHKLGLADGTLKFEVMVETPQIIMDSRGTSLLARVRDASKRQSFEGAFERCGAKSDIEMPLAPGNVQLRRAIHDRLDLRQ